MAKVKNGPEKIQSDLIQHAVDLDSISLDPRNARLHPAENLDQIKLSLLRYGQCKPVVVNRATGIIEAGNGMVTAARELGWKRIAVAYVDHSPEDAMAYGIMDNKSGLSSEWNTDNLKDILQELDTGAFDMNLTGFNESELEELMTQTPPPGAGNGKGEDDVNENVPEICRAGDLWILGDSRLICGDADDVAVLDRLMAGEKARLILTDPPYGINLDTDYTNISGGWTGQIPYTKSKKYKKVINDDKPFSPARLLDYYADVAEIILFGANYYASGLETGAWYVWDKTEDAHFTTVGSEFELAWSKQKHRQQILRIGWAGSMGLASQDVKHRIHPTQKPVQLFEFFIDKCTKGGDIVVDLYGGSGTALIAAEKLQRRCFMLELDPKYCDIIIDRWQRYTGLEGKVERLPTPA